MKGHSQRGSEFQMNHKMVLAVLAPNVSRIDRRLVASRLPSPHRTGLGPSAVVLSSQSTVSLKDVIAFHFDQTCVLCLFLDNSSSKDSRCYITVSIPPFLFILVLFRHGIVNVGPSFLSNL